MSDDADPAKARPLAICRSYDELRRAIAARCDDILMTRELLDAKSGLASGHSGRLLSPRAITKFGHISLGLVLAATGLVLIVAEDSEALDRIARQRDASHTHASQRRPGKRPRRKYRFPKGPEHARIMAARRAIKLSRQQRIASARKAAEARWQRRTTGGVNGSGR